MGHIPFQCTSTTAPSSSDPIYSNEPKALLLIWGVISSSEWTIRIVRKIMTVSLSCCENHTLLALLSHERCLKMCALIPGHPVYCVYHFSGYVLYGPITVFLFGTRKGIFVHGFGWFWYTFGNIGLLRLLHAHKYSCGNGFPFSGSGTHEVESYVHGKQRLSTN